MGLAAVREIGGSAVAVEEGFLHIMSARRVNYRPRCLELCIKVMRKRLQRVGGTQNGKSELDGPSYAEFYQEHDGNLTLDVWWPNHE